MPYLIVHFCYFLACQCVVSTVGQFLTCVMWFSQCVHDPSELVGRLEIVTCCSSIWMLMFEPFVIHCFVFFQVWIV